MKLVTTISSTLVMSALLVALDGCEGKEGPAEQAGKEVDQAAEKAGESIQDTAKGDEK